MITQKHNGVQYSELTENVRDFILDNEITVAWVDRSLTYDNDEFVDDITEEEVKKGQEYFYEKLRREAYRNEADPLYLKWQRGEATEQEWLDKIEEIKARFPKPE